MQQIQSLSKRVLALLVIAIMLISMLPISMFTAAAANSTSIGTNVDTQTYYVGVEKGFTYTSNVSAEDAGKDVIASFKLLDASDNDVMSAAVDTLLYWGVSEGQWLPLVGSTFGPAAGFPFTDGLTSKFKVNFKAAGTYYAVVEMIEVSTSAVLASSRKEIIVKNTAAEMSSDISTKSFEVNETVEFTYTSTPNDLAGEMVLGTFDLLDSNGNDAENDVKLEYYNVNTGTFDEFYGDFGPALTGFPMSVATSTFRATFNKTGTYTVNASMVRSNNREVLCSNNATIVVKDTKNPVISEITGNATTWTNGDVTLKIIATDNSGSVASYRMKKSTDETWGAWQANNKFTVTENASYTFQAKDATGNESATSSVEVVKIDKTAPTVSVSLNPNAIRPDGSWTKDEITVTMTATDEAGSGIKEYFVDGVSQSESTFKVTDTNEHKVQAVDKAGNVSDEVKFSAMYDTTAPVVNSIDGNPTEWTKEDITLIVNAIDTGCNGMQYKMNDGEWQSSNTFTISENGTYKFYVKDALANETTGDQVVVTKIDKNAPTISNYTSTTEEWTNENVTISGTFSDNSGDTITAYSKVGTGDWEPLTLDGDNKFEITVSEECNTTYMFKAVDKAGMEFETAAKAVKIDKTKATLTANSISEDWKKAQIDITGSVSDSASGIQSATYTNNLGDTGNLSIIGTDYVFTTNVPTGVYTYTITVFDNAGNKTKITTDEVHVDLTKPVVNSVTPSIAGWTNDAVTVTVDVFDANSQISKVYYKKDGTKTDINKNDGVYSFEILNNANDNAEYTIYCEDNAGNESEGSTYTSFIDITAPAKPTIKYNKSIIDKFLETITFGLYNAEVKVTITATDDLSGIKEVKYYKGETAFTEPLVDGKIEFEVTENFKGKITAIAYDNAGNNSVEQDKSYDLDDEEVNGIIVDLTKPVVESISASITDWTNQDVVIRGTVSDNLSGVKNVYWRQSSDTTENDVAVDETGYYEFTVNRQNFTGLIYVGCYDYANNKADEADIALYMDIEAPSVNSGTAASATWTNEKVIITGTVSDAEVNHARSDVVEVKCKYNNNIEKTGILENGEYTIEIPATDYKGNVTVWCVDDAGNVSDEFNVPVYMDITKPVISSGEANPSSWTSQNVVISGALTDITTNNAVSEIKEVRCRYNNGIEKTGSFVNGKYTIEIPATNYKGDVAVWCIDNAGNVSGEFNVPVYMDVTAPSDVTITYDNSLLDKVLESITFGFYKADVRVTVKAKDNLALEKIKYTIDGVRGNFDNTAVTKTETLDVTSITRNDAGDIIEGKIEFTVEPEYKGKVNAVAYDCAGNNTAKELNNEDNGHSQVIVDNVAPEISVTYSKDDTTQVQKVDDTYFFDGKVTATIEVTENNFFEGSSTVNSEKIHELGIKVTKIGNAGDETIIEYKPTGTANKYVADETVEFDWSHSGMKHTFAFDMADDADYRVEIEYADFSGNSAGIEDSNAVVGTDGTYTSDIITVDNMDPQVTVVYDNNTVVNTSSDGRKYFNSNRKATITVIEHNFRASDFINTITAKDIMNDDVAGAEIGNWNDQGDVHTLEIKFHKDANYSYDYTFKDLAQRSAATYTEDVFTVDKEIAQNIKIEYQDSILNKLIETATFGFYKAPVEMTVTAEDETAGVEYFKFKYTKESGSSAVNTDSFTTEELTATQDTTDKKVFTTTYTIPAQARGTVEVEVMDRAGNSTDKDVNVVDNGHDTVVVDTIAPKISVNYVANSDATKVQYTKDGATVNDFANADTAYYNGAVTAKIEIDEANFFEGKNSDTGIVHEVGVKLTKTDNAGNVTVYEYLPEGAVQKYGEATAKPLTWSHNGDKHSFEIAYTDDADYVLEVEYTDYSEQASKITSNDGKTATAVYTSKVVTIDNTDPRFAVSYDNNDVWRNDGVYKVDRTPTIKINEHNFRADEVELSITAEDINGNTVNLSAKGYAEYAKNPDNWESDGDVRTLKKEGVKLDVDGIYNIKIDYTDLAKRAAAQYTDSFTIDKTDAQNIKIEYDSSILNKLIETATFGFYKAPIEMTVTAEDETAGVEYFKFKYTKESGSSAVNTDSFTTEELTATQDTTDKKVFTTTYTIPAQARGAVEVEVMDRAGNSTDKDVNVVDNGHDTVVVDKIAPKISVNYVADSDDTKVQYTKDGATVNDFANADTAYYNGAVTAKIEIDEANFFEGKESDTGIVHEVGVKLTKTDNNGNVTVYEYLPEGAVQKYGEATAKPLTWAHNGDKHSFEIAYTDDADYVLEVEYTDYSEQASKITSNDGKTATAVYTSKVVTIDNTDPIVTVVYDNNTAISTLNGRQYFDSNRKATVTVIEHNFRESDFVNTIVAKNVAGDDVIGAVVEKWTHDGDVHTAIIKFNNDANYSYDCAFEDLAQRKATDYTEDLFTVDKANPYNLTVTYKGDVKKTIIDKVLNILTFGYYDAKVTVEITADDATAGVDNFVYSYLKTTGVSNVNAELANQTIESASITQEGKTFTTTFEIPKKALAKTNQFNGTVKFTATDRSARATEHQETERIVVDNIKPIATITYNEPVQEANDISYYAGNIDAKIVIEEANFYSKDVKVTATKDGASYPITVNWVDDSVDVHTGTFTLTEDGDYIITVEYADRSGNAIDTYTSNRLTLDTKAPTITLSNVKQNSANRDEKYSFTITAKDINLDPNSFKPTLTAVVRKEDGTFANKVISLGNMVTVEAGKEYSYSVDNLGTDAIYSFVATVKDMSNNEYSKITLSDNQELDLVRFSINREGSTYAVDSNTMDLIEKYYVQKVYDNVVIEEVNVDTLKEYALTLNSKELKKDIDYTVSETGGGDKWKKYTYSVNKSLFENEGEYRVVVSSKDKAKNDAFSDVKGATVDFVVDNTPPVVSVTGLATDGRYQIDRQTVTLIPADDGGALNSLAVKLVDDNGKELKEIINLSGEQFAKALDTGAGEITFEIEEGLYQNIRIICNDCAVDEKGNTNVYDETFKNVSVSTSAIKIFWAGNRYKVLVGVCVIPLGAATVVFFKKRRKIRKL